ncbi:MAG: hypothetical protein H7318_12085, partial [Oligoflexus sp.]|nr:hypothetical protein [Oligoflexus sp.]
LKIGPVRVKLPRAIADFTIEQKEDGHYIRTIKLLGKTALVYDFIRIIDKNKQPVTVTADDRWNRFIADPRKLTIPKKKL